MPQSLFLQMPLHLIRLVLADLDCIQSLGSAILSHSIMYAAFKEYPKAVMNRIVLNQIPPELIYYAAIAYNTSRNVHLGPRETRKLIRHAFRSARGLLAEEARIRLWRSLNRGRFSPTFVASLSTTHMLVQHFTRHYLNATLPIAARDLFHGQSPTNVRRPSEDEIYRVRRAFYRFHIYCNITRFEGDDDPQHSELAQSFLHRWSPWVNEQLACIHDYLEGVLSKAFDEVAAHDIAWGAKSVDWVSRGQDNKYKQTYLSYGLPFLYKIDCTNNYEERLRLLESHGLTCTTYGLAADLGSNAVPSRLLNPRWNDKLRRWHADEFEVLLKEDSDGPDGLLSGPFHIWRYAHKYLSNSIFHPENWLLRRCGYVLWDAPVLTEETRDEIDFLRKAISEIKKKGRDGLNVHEWAKEEMGRSWAERTEVLQSGGHGYWSHGDLSKVVWDDKPYQVDPDIVCVTSLGGCQLDNTLVRTLDGSPHRGA